jgi:hypothetical protein
VRDNAPDWITLFHDSFRLNQETWGDFLKNCPNYAYDSHIYQAWAWENDGQWFQEHACSDGNHLKLMESLGIPVVVGEWSLATVCQIFILSSSLDLTCQRITVRCG